MTRLEFCVKEGEITAMKKILIFMAALVLMSSCAANSASEEPESSSPSITPTQEVAVNIPAVGNCYNFTKEDVSGSGYDKGPVDCNESHTAETYRVATWPLDTHPDDMKYEKAKKIIDSLCIPFKGKTKYFNYWAWYMPTPEQFAEGDRWVRCDALVVVGEDAENWEYAVWEGAILDIS